jgi:hypothetical protein|tara:strand:- start:340 stop:450 length:111 start_codon:yes stop_codon:yes gene_type:complete
MEVGTDVGTDVGTNVGAEVGMYLHERGGRKEKRRGE